uniref:Uncharacterized protein n=1 Tax=Vitis vinifera TaxID=29760 RepID=F6HQ27_VITVI
MNYGQKSMQGLMWIRMGVICLSYNIFGLFPAYLLLPYHETEGRNLYHCIKRDKVIKVCIWTQLRKG